MSDEGSPAPRNQWRGKPKRTPMDPDSAARQGDITRLAIQILGKDRAIAFLNTDHGELGGRPIALATDDKAGKLAVEAELGRMRERQSDEFEG